MLEGRPAAVLHRVKMGRRVGPTRILVKGVLITLAPETEGDPMKKALLLMLIVCAVLAIAAPVYADWDNAKHPDHNPGDGTPGAGHNANHPIPPNDSGHADAPGPVGPGP